jgi:hypothetical protein
MEARSKVMGIVAGANPASKLAGGKAAASCRTPKLRIRFIELFRNLFSPALPTTTNSFPCLCNRVLRALLA